MSDSADTAAWVAALAAMAALPVAVAAYVRSGRALEAADRQALAAETQARQQTERLREERAAQRLAHVSAAIDGRALVVTNRGPAVATNVRITPRPQEPAGIVEVVFQHVAPLAALPAGAERRFPLFTFDQAPETYHVALEWEQPSGTPGRWACELAR